ncbi:hypothetical protein N7539_008908 [Penicillium diatomitis]|uniref:Uncharacterized protein n=1 Tax=Penicillium diatomitis TaxID=2819901 RepID=A0A9W9WKQ2_9EURO|nr:uncharacterized protein N7539_008908 [Penicillium diatomitis]KAJ5469290.1 hypothetical protein N7539_008908 [Penicillium diatomitis]
MKQFQHQQGNRPTLTRRPHHHSDGQVTIFVMDYNVPGKRLDEAWNLLDAEQKLSMADELHSYLEQLRDLKGD